jgi:hypothetical protein
MATLKVPAVVKLQENVIDQIYNFSPDKAPLVSMIPSESVHNVYFEWQRDIYRAANRDNAALEGAAAAPAAPDQPGLLNNRTQIFQDSFSISGTAEAVKKYGRKSERARELMKVAVELKKDQDAAMISSGVTVTDNGTNAGKLRGLYGFFTNDVFGSGGASPDPTANTNATSGTDVALTEAMIKNAQQSCYEYGGDGSVLMCSPAHKVKISTFDFGVQRTHEVTAKAADTQPIAFDFIRGDFGTIKVVPNRNQAIAAVGLNDTLYMFDADKLAKAVLRPYQVKKLAEVGDSEEHQVLTEVSLIVKDERTCYAIRDITVSGS